MGERYLTLLAEPGDAAGTVNRYLEAVFGWMRTSKLKLNPDKMEEGRIRIFFSFG